MSEWRISRYCEKCGRIMTPIPSYNGLYYISTEWRCECGNSVMEYPIWAEG